jgi:hypothetical protein
MRSTEEEIVELFESLAKIAQDQGGLGHVKLMLDEEAGLNQCGEPAYRSFAYTEIDEPIIIALAPKILDQPKPRIMGILLHELGHAMLISQGRIHHSEREADSIAERVFGEKIYYDYADVQNNQFGIRPRPSHLDTFECSSKMVHKVSK